MAASPEISLTVVRFLSNEDEGDDELEKKLDDGLVTWFWVKNEGNDRVVYREVVVKNGEETISAIHGMNNDSCDLWIMGRKHGINHVLLQGLSNWSEETELGVIGDYVASVDFATGCFHFGSATANLKRARAGFRIFMVYKLAVDVKEVDTF
ncbi:Cation/H(+) antiporter 24 [Sesamum alatum]|uniref:Cation/H(+) antiporter 24 n=1 Tax=Sesamum alatum TaxID=300844 RepID=A0AAE1XID4_9LAMI|nr:Cation/H(+) antiporter 24 [Sesamum alatum]